MLKWGDIFPLLCCCISSFPESLSSVLSHCGHAPPHVTGPLADYMSSSLFRLMYLHSLVKRLFLEAFILATEASFQCFSKPTMASHIFTVIFPCFLMTAPVYTDVTPRKRVVVECWISLQGVKHGPQGKPLPPTDTENEGGGDWCRGQGWMKLNLSVWSQIVKFLEEECTVRPLQQ